MIQNVERNAEVAHAQYTAKIVDVSVVSQSHLLNPTTQVVDRPAPVPQKMTKQRRVIVPT